MKTPLIAALALLLLFPLSTPLTLANDRPDYAEGQVWSYRSRGTEPESRATIVRIDVIGGETIYHVHLDGLKIKNPKSASGVQEVLPHVPASEQTLSISLQKLLEPRLTELPDIAEGYAIWREAFDAGQAGVFSISLAEVVDSIEMALTAP